MSAMPSYDDWKGRSDRDEHPAPEDAEDDILIDGEWLRSTVKRQRAEIAALREQRDAVVAAAARVCALHIPFESRPTLTSVATSEIDRLTAAVRKARGGA